MERSERINPKSPNWLATVMRSAMESHQAEVWTALPALVTAFDSAKLTVTVQPAIKVQVRQPNGTWINVALPLCTDCPVIFPGGGGYTLTFPVAEGDEGLLVFASRCIDGWWQNGGVQNQAELRMHDLSDGFFLPSGGMSNAKVPGNIVTTGAELRSNDGKNVVHLGATSVELSVNAGATSLIVDDSAHRVSIVAIGGLWVNGVEVVVP